MSAAASLLRRSRRGAAALATLGLTLLAAAAMCGCGGIAAPDLFIVQRSGAGPHAALTLLVNEEGGVTCNGAKTADGHKLMLSDPELVEARAIQEDLQEPASKHLSLAPGPKSVFGYYVRDENGTVRFSDDSAGQPEVLRHLALFVLQVGQRVCGLPE